MLVIFRAWFFDLAVFLRNQHWLVTLILKDILNFQFLSYALSAEAVKAHSSVDRPPIYEIVFDTDPRVRTGATGYTWLSRDTEVLSNQQTINHNGILFSAAAQY